MNKNISKIGLVFNSLLNGMPIKIYNEELSIHECDDDSYIFGRLDDDVVYGYTDVSLQQIIDYAQNLTEEECINLSFSNAMKKLQCKI